jgi:hypothetical protein
MPITIGNKRLQQQSRRYNVCQEMVFKLAPSFLTYLITLSNNSYQANNSFNYTTMLAPNVSWTSKIPYFQCDMTCFPFFVDGIYDRCKSIKTSLKHPQVKSGSSCGHFNKSKKHISFHSFINHVRDNLIGELLFLNKHDTITQMKDKPFQPDVFSGIRHVVADTPPSYLSDQKRVQLC